MLGAARTTRIHVAPKYLSGRFPGADVFLQIHIPVSTRADEWTAAEVLRDEFTHVQMTDDAIDATAELENETEAGVELFARFLGFVAGKLDEDGQSETARTFIHLKSLKSFTASHLTSQDIHVIVAAFDTEVRKTVLAAYYQALAALEAKSVSDIPRAPASALLSAASRRDASIYALFGQGTNELYFDELQTLHDIYKSYVASFLDKQEALRRTRRAAHEASAGQRGEAGCV